MRKIVLLAALAPAALLAGCATPAYVSPVSVTRFIGAQPAVLGSGPIAVRAAPGQDPASWDFAAYQTAVAEQLRQIGYTVTGDAAAQVAEVSIRRATNRAAGGRSPVDVGVGGSTGSYGSGLGVGIGLNLGGRPADQIDSELRVTIKPSGGVNNLWEGSARFTATTNSDYADLTASAAKLADALFDGFPGRSGETIEVR
ncbi:MAG: DUF4136 domain-containing protein [Croceibacterium sp.]